MDNRTLIISGGLGDIGSALCRKFAAAGITVACGDRHPEPAAGPLRKEVESMGSSFHYSMVDVTCAEEVSKWVAQVADRFGAPNIIIPNAAIVTKESLRSISPAQWQRELETNLSGVFHLCQIAAEHLIAQASPDSNDPRGHIVMIGSWAGHAPHHNMPAYSVSKAGLRMLMKLAALEYSAHGIRVNEIAPGCVDAGLSRAIFRENPETKNEMLRKVPVGELIPPSEVAEAAWFLCSPAARNCTGSVHLMDGGLSLRQGTEP